MDCLAASFAGQPLLTRFEMESVKNNQTIMIGWNSNKCFRRLIKLHQDSVSPISRNLTCGRICCTSPASLEKEISGIQSQGFAMDDGSDLKDFPDESSSQCLNNEQLRVLVTDSERSKLIRKLSEANNHNRILKRQLQEKEDELVDFRSELVAVELEIQATVALAEEVANFDIPLGSRKINGKYIQPHLLSRLEAIQKRLKAQIKDVNAVQSKEVTLFWYGVAESVRIMGSFDGWSQGEDLSPEYNDPPFSKFTTTLKLRPGRYEVKFLVDGKWRVSPEFPTVGDDWAQNNLLIVDP